MGTQECPDMKIIRLALDYMMQTSAFESEKIKIAEAAKTFSMEYIPIYRHALTMIYQRTNDQVSAAFNMAQKDREILVPFYRQQLQSIHKTLQEL